MCWIKKLDKIFTWVDASYELHHGMKSQTEGVMYMGLGVTHCRPSNKKLNMKSSNEPGIVGASDYVPYNIWYVMFMHHQGYLNKSNKFSHENQSSTMMEVNGRNYCTESRGMFISGIYSLKIGLTRRN